MAPLLGVDIERREAMKKILVVEDDSFLRESLKIFLETMRFEVVTAPTLEEGMRALAARPDLLLADYNIPDGGEGLLLVREAKRLGIPSIILSGDAYLPVVQSKAYAEGCSAVFPKPPQWKEFGETIRRLINITSQQKVDIL